ncbi:MAG TPA: NIPSNAP family protein [Lacipirellulaceae bacterium]|nr:NIPSNAP family protein [Lacipirellulaceae bacterium]
MKRRDFLAASALATAAVARTDAPALGQLAAENRSLIEWRTYRLKEAAQQERVHEHLEKAFIPSLERFFRAPVGVFTEIGPDAGPSIHVLLHYHSSFLLKQSEYLYADMTYQNAAKSYLSTSKDDPAFERIESSLMLAFEGAPEVTPPARGPRVFEVRTYESHSEERALKKIAMFNLLEIPIFGRCGFEPVFFGQTLIGAGLPNLRYMLAARDMAANEAAWKTFVDHPDWLRIRDLPEYRDTVSKIHKLFLEPTVYSQI